MAVIGKPQKVWELPAPVETPKPAPVKEPVKAPEKVPA